MARRASLAALGAGVCGLPVGHAAETGAHLQQEAHPCMVYQSGSFAEQAVPAPHLLRFSTQVTQVPQVCCM